MAQPQPMNDEEVKVAAYEILRYMLQNPNAQDTLEGIARWWLLGENIKYQEPLVQKALNMMVADGLVIAHETADSRTLYKLYSREAKNDFTNETDP